jgi:hypothetical protein
VVVNIKKILFIPVVFIFHFAHADTITVIRPLSLGTVVILNNSSQGEIRVRLDGQMVNTSSIGVLVSGHPAEFLFTTFPGLTRLSITPIIMLSETSSNAPANSAQFTVINLESPATVLTDSDGTATVLMGATFRTSGNVAEEYYDTDYSVRVQLSIDY